MTTVSEFEAVDTIQAALSRSIGYFLRTQASEGYWVGELESNATITAEYLFLCRLLQKSARHQEADIVQHLLNGQVDGGWAVFYGGPPDLNLDNLSVGTKEAATAKIQADGYCQSSVTVDPEAGMSGQRRAALVSRLRPR